jgi:hypothetical protein
MIIIDLMFGRKKNALTVVFTIRAFRIIVKALVLPDSPYAAANEYCVLIDCVPELFGVACRLTVPLS